MACGLAPEIVAILSVTAGLTLPIVGGVAYIHLKLTNCIDTNEFCEGFLRILCCGQRYIGAPDVEADMTVKTIERQPPPYTYRENVSISESTF